MKAGLFSGGFVFADDAQAAERGHHVHATFTRRLAHIGNQRFVGLKGNTLFELPAQHGYGFLGAAGKLLKVLDEYANHRVGEQQRRVLFLHAETVANAFHSGTDGGGIHQVGFHGGGNDGARRQGLHRKTIQRSGTRKPSSGNAVRSNLDGHGRMWLRVQPQSNLADKIALVDAVPVSRR